MITEAALYGVLLRLSVSPGQLRDSSESDDTISDALQRRLSPVRDGGVSLRALRVWSGQSPPETRPTFPDVGERLTCMGYSTFYASATDDPVSV